MNGKIKYEFNGMVWQYSSPNGWHFISLPIAMANEIRENLQWQEEGWGRLKAKAAIGNIQWETAIWFDTKHKTYLMPIKAEIRKKATIVTGKDIDITIWI